MFSHWGCTKAVEVRKLDVTHHIDDDSIEHPETSFVLYSFKMSIRVLNEFMVYLPKYESESGSAFEFVEGSIFTLSRYDAFIATAVVSLCSDGTDKARGHRQWRNHGTFASFLSKAFHQMVGTIRIFTLLRCLAELSLTTLTTNSNFRLAETIRETTMDIFASSLKQRPVTDFWKRFRQYTTTGFGVVLTATKQSTTLPL